MSDNPTADDDLAPDQTPTGEWLLPHLRGLAPGEIPASVAARVTAAIAATAGQPALAEVPASADAAPRGGSAEDRARRRWWPAVLGVAAAGLAGVVIVSSLQSPGAQDGPIAGPLGEVVPVASGTEYAPESMTELITRNLKAEARLTPAGASVTQATFSGSRAGIDSCLVGIGQPPQELAMLDLARFRNAPAAVLVFLSDSTDSSADVVVVGPGCSQRQPEVRHRSVAYVQR